MGSTPSLLSGGAGWGLGEGLGEGRRKGLFTEATESNCQAPTPSVRGELPHPHSTIVRDNSEDSDPGRVQSQLRFRPRFEMDLESHLLIQFPSLDSGVLGQHLNGAMAVTGPFLLRSSPLCLAVFQGFLPLAIAAAVHLEAHAPQIYIRFTKPHQTV